MASPGRAELLLEAEGRGFQIPPEDRALLKEARRRGLIREGIIGSGLGTGTFGATKEFEEKAASVTGQSIIPLLLSTVGAIAGARVPGAGPLARAGASAVGAGVGAAAGEAANPAAFRAIGATPPPQPSFFDLAKSFGLTALLDLVGQGAVAAGRWMIPSLAARPGAQETLRAMRETGVEPKVTDISGARTPAMVERAVQQTIGGQEIIAETAERQAGQIRRASEEFLGRITPEGAGSAVAVGGKAAESVRRQAHRVQEVEDYLWQEMRGMATDLPVSPTALKRAAQEIRLQQERLLPSQRNKALTGLLKDIDDAPPQILWQRADEMRREFGAQVSKGELITGVDPGQSSRLHAALMQDMERAAGTSDIPGLGQVYRQVRQFGAQVRGLFRDSQVAKVMDADPEKVVDILTAGGPSAVQRAREAVMGSGRMGLAAPDPTARQTWDLVRRHMLEGVFDKARDKSARGFVTEPISGVRLENALERLGDDTLKELLTPIERKALDNIVTVAKAVRLGERAGASGFTSGTAGALGVQAFLAAPGAAAGAALAGGPGAAVGGAVSLVFTPIPLAKLLTNPRAAAFLASPRVAAAARRAAALGRMTGELSRAGLRLSAILAEESSREGQHR